MKKAKRLLAVLLAAVMLASAACLPAYAKALPGSDYSTPAGFTNDRKYYFTAEQGASQLLDQLDEMLHEAYLKMDWDDIFDGGNTIIDIANFLLGDDIPEELDFASIDGAVNTLYGFIDAVDSGLGGAIADIDALAGDITKEGNLQLGPLDDSIDRGTRDNNYDGGHADLKVLYNLLGWLDANTWFLQQVVAGTMPMGALGDMIYDLANIDGIALLPDLDTGITNLLYNMLIDSTATSMPAGMTLEDAIQKMIDWALIEGTGESAADGGFSMLGMNHEPLMPALADKTKYPGGISLTDVDFYQLVNNLINGLLNGMLAPQLGEIIADAVGVEITDQYPNGDPEILTDVMFSTIVGAVEGLLVQNGADPIVYSEAAGQETPMGKINDLVNWLFNGSQGGKPALYTFINISYEGIGLTDNFMSLLNDLVRLAINLLPALGIELPANSGLPSADELTATNWYKIDANGNKVLCDEGDEGAVDQLYMTYYGQRVCYATYTDDTKKEVAYYTYLDTNMPVNTADTSAAEYEDEGFIRPYYKISMTSVWASLVKMLFSMFVDGPYFPEWATTMESVLAYGAAGLAVSVLPEEDFYSRLDAYYLSGYSTAPYTMAGKTVYPIAYSNVTARSAAALPTGAMSILSSVGAYYLNSMLDLSAAEKFETHDTSFEQLLTELALWGFIEYVPILAGELTEDAKHVRETAYTDNYNSQHPVGTYAAQVNDLIDAVYSDFSTRTELANPNYDAVYTFLDQTLFSLLPASWLPAQFGSSRALFNDWLFSNLVEFDLQGILSLFTANPDGELALPALTVVLRIIDRVLATVFGGEALMLPLDRNGTGSNSVYARHTSITTLSALIEDGDGGEGDENTPRNASLPALVGKLFNLINKYRAPMFETILPIIIGSSFERPFDHDALGTDSSFVNVLGNDMTKFKIADLENQLDYLTRNVNADFYATYATEEAAEAAAESLGDAYVETVEKTPATATSEAVYEYKVYKNRSYFDAATRTPATDSAGDYSIFSNFNYKSITPATTSQPLVKWDNGAYYFWSIEDTNPNGYYYSNFNKAIEDAESFVDSYNGFVTDSLSDAFGDWLIYTIEAQLAASDKFDRNNDGRAVLSESDPDYLAPTTDANGNVTNPGYPVDGYPSIPGSMYPYLSSTSDTTTVKWLDYVIDDYVSQPRNSFNATNYELIALANEYGSNPANNVELSLIDTENVVRLALNTLDFDITANADGSYNGQYQWEDLQEVQLASVANFCSANNMRFDYDVANGVYKISRRSVAFITDSFYLGTLDDGTTAIPTAPIASRLYKYEPSEIEETQNEIYDAYIEFCDSLYSMRRSLYNQLDTINWRMKEAESMRKTSVDTTMLEWAKNHVAHAYKSESDKRNLIEGDIVDGVVQYTKIYTQSSYNAFRDAYDFANSIIDNKGQAAGLTQSMVTEAFQKLLAAYNALVEYTGPADWLQFLEILAQAKELADPDGIRNDPELGFEKESIESLDGVITEADSLYANEDVMDCENQDEIDTMSSKIETAILQLKYLSDPKLRVNTAVEGDTAVIETATGARTVGHIIGLLEGQGITMDLVEEYGMTVNETVGNEVSILESSKGLGTGAYYRGTVGGLEKFRYYAVLYGDLNGDARIDGTDWSRIRYSVITGNNETTAGMGGDYIYEAADVDHDGDVDSDDATIIRDYYNYAAEIVQASHSTAIVTQ